MDDSTYDRTWRTWNAKTLAEVTAELIEADRQMKNTQDDPENYRYAVDRYSIMRELFGRKGGDIRSVFPNAR